MPPSSVTLKTEPKPESDYLPEPEEPLPVTVELPSELLPEEEEPINLS